MDGLSLSPEQEKLNALKQVLPEVFTEGKVDWEKLKATLGEDINFSNERYVLNWAGKSEAFKVLQAPTTKTLVPSKDESVNFDTTEHIFIEGENLEVLKVLQKSYFGKVKMIYIDPPYNTGNDSFIYPDKFSETKEEYEKRVGDKDEEGYMTKDGMFKKNSKENGQYHSNWLNMMMPRLYLAKNLLKQDGVIFISIDDNEVHNLRILMNEIFGEDNFVGKFIRQSKVGGGSDSKHIVKEHEYCFVYSKNIMCLEEFFTKHEIDYLKRYKEEDENGRYFWDTLARGGLKNPIRFEVEAPDGTKLIDNWNRAKETFYRDLKLGEIQFKKKKNGEWNVYFKQRLNEKGKKPRSLTSKLGTTIDGKNVIKKLFENDKVFSYPKPIKLIQYLSKIVDTENEIILDFFSGSGTTAHAVMALNVEDGGSRKSISVQLPEKCDEKSEAYKAGYNTIADIAKERIRRAAKKIQEEHPDYKGDLGFKVYKIADSNFKQWQQLKGKDAKSLEAQMELFVDPVAKNATTENMVYELLLKSGKDLNSKIEDNHGYFLIDGNEIALILEKVNQDIITEVIAEYPKKVIALDKLFNEQDQLKTNASLQMKDAGIEFKTI